MVDLAAPTPLVGHMRTILSLDPDTNSVPVPVPVPVGEKDTKRMCPTCSLYILVGVVRFRMSKT